ncbi:isochorismatase family protein [Rhodococcus sp. IEGM1428]|uniref:isochorismatase family protein n=1 Tax=Rhodococcus sp. IEGM1428 TaxID=3392191 RepID=UPI003D12D837
MPIDVIASNAALVVIDLQVGVTQGIETFPHSVDTVVDNASRLVEAFHDSNRPVVFVTVWYGPNNELQPHMPCEAPMNFAPPAGWNELDPRFDVHADDIHIVKPAVSSFFGTDLDVQLSRRGIGSIVVVGIATNIGGEGTVRSGYDRGYHQVVVSDAMSATSGELHEHTMHNVFPMMANIASTDDVIRALQG